MDGLMQVFQFDHEDLQANRQGKLSATQQKRWAEAEQWSQSVLQTTLPLAVAVLLAAVGVAVSQFLAQPLWGTVVSLGLSVLVGGWLSLRNRRNGRAAPTTQIKVHKAEGIAHLKDPIDHDEHDSSRRYRLEINHHTFQLFRKVQFEALENGARYAVYYLDDDDKYILSLEKLG